MKLILANVTLRRIFFPKDNSAILSNNLLEIIREVMDSKFNVTNNVINRNFPRVYGKTKPFIYETKKKGLNHS